MSKKLFSIALLVALSVGIFSCGDDEKGPSSSFTFDDETYTIKKGYRSEFGEVTTGVYEHDIALYDKEVTASNLNQNFNIAEFTLYTNSETSIPDGVYNFGANETPLTLAYGSLSINLNLSTFAGDFYDVESGTLTVSNSGKKVEFDVIVEGGKTAKGTFNGTLEVNN